MQHRESSNAAGAGLLVEDPAALKRIAPWTPVRAKTGEAGVEVDVWGRTYRFADALLPTSVATAGGEILAAPIRLAGRENGKPLAWKTGGARLFNRTDAAAVVSGWQTSGGFIANSTTRVEFDGLMRVDLTLMPQKGVASALEQLWLEIPLRRDKASLYHFWPGEWGSAKNSGALPGTGLKLPFKPFVWLGWEAGGLGWFAESDQGWRPQDANEAIEIAANGDETVLRLRLLDAAPPRLPVTFTFGFQATPVKPWKREFHDWRVCHGAFYGMESKPVEAGAKETVLDRAAKRGVGTLVFHENWTPIQNYPATDRETELKSLVNACHKRGIKLLLYFGYEFSTLAPEWGRLGDESVVKTPEGEYKTVWQREPAQRDYVVCYNSRWREALLAGILRALDRYGFDGVYLDGTIVPCDCANEKHGCGWRAPDGTLRPTYPIFAVRKLMHGLAAAIHRRGGLVNAHQSTCCVTPTLGFADSYWDGEQFMGGELAGDAAMRLLPLAAFRAEFMGRNFGVPAEFLIYEKPPHWTFDHALAFTMLHDVRVRPGNPGTALERMAPIWEVMKRFGVSRAGWHPYWEENPCVTGQTDTVKASWYGRAGRKRGEGRVLLVVANLGAEPAAAELRLDGKRMGLRTAGAAAKDALTGEDVRFKDDRLTIPLPSLRMRMVWME